MLMLFFLVLSIGIARSNSGGPPDAVTGVPAGHGLPAELTCNQSGCHDEFELNPDTQTRITLAGLPDNYVPGRRYQLTLGITTPDMERAEWGFEATAVAANTFLRAGDLLRSTVAAEARNVQIIMGGPAGQRQYVQHTAVGTGQGRRGGFSWRFDWVAPGVNVGDVNFYASVNAADSDARQTGDKVYNPTPNPVAVTRGQFAFTNVAASAGVASANGRGVAAGDYDGDGDIDLFVAGTYALYRNNGGGAFEDVAQMSGLTAGMAEGRAAAWLNYDGDDDLDLYVANAGADRLYRNDYGVFTDVSMDTGISDNAVGNAVAVGDVNGDGQADIYVANAGQDVLYVNDEHGAFSRNQLSMENATGWAVAMADYNKDNRLDIFVANGAGEADLLYRNDGNGMFTEVAGAAGVQSTSADGRGAVWLDYDKDNDADLFVVNTGSDLLYRNNNGMFTDVTTAAGLVDMAVGAAAAAADYDKDGDADVFVANDGQDFLYRNNGNGTFNQVATFSGMTDTAAGRAAAWLDATGDGNADLFVGNAEGGNFLYRNPGQAGPPSSAPADESLVSRVMRLVKNWIG
jgi:hypothetical protein